ncbi:hypothetical protein K435DRAFT_674539, partial [Dendrothele bispora CBS 962.96]
DLNLSNNDWKKLEQLELLLETFTRVTLRMSSKNEPTLPYVLPMYRVMEKELKVACANENFPEVFKFAARAGLVRLDKLMSYHNKAKNNQFYVVATGKSFFLLMN